MTIEQVRNVANAQPFVPFVVHLAEGREIPVAHRDFIAMSPTGRILTIFYAQDRSAFVDVLLITDLELRPNSASSKAA